MLVLTRKRCESIVIDDEVEIVVQHIGAGRVRLGIQAPLKYRIGRIGQGPPDPAVVVMPDSPAAPPRQGNGFVEPHSAG